MPKFAKRILITLGVLAGLLAVLLFAANIYVQSGLSQEHLADELSRALRMPVKVGTISISPWGGLSIAGITAPQPDPGNAGNFLEAESFTARFEWLPLLRRRVVISDIELKNPHLTWFQNKRGKWRLPDKPKPRAEKTPEPPPETAQPAAEPVTPAATPEPAATAPVEKPERGLPVEIAIDRMRFTDGTFTFNDRKGRPMAVFSGVRALSSAPTLNAVSGTATIERIVIQDKVTVENVTTPFTYQPEQLTLPSLDARVAGGRLTGRFQIKLKEEGSPIDMAAKFENVDLSRLLEEAGGPADRASGKLHGSLELAGKSDDNKTLKGRATFRGEGGQIRNYGLFETLATLFRAEELARLDLRQAAADGRFDGGFFLLDHFALETPNVLLTATGRVKLDGKLDLDARLALAEKITRKLPDFIVEAFTPGETPGTRQIGFDVTGTLEKPKTNLVERLGMKNLENQAMDLIQSIFGSGGKKKDGVK